MENEDVAQFEEAQHQQQLYKPMLNLSLNVDEVNIIFSALGELPHRISDPVIRNVMQQAQAQIEKPN